MPLKTQKNRSVIESLGDEVGRGRSSGAAERAEICGGQDSIGGQANCDGVSSHVCREHTPR